MVNILDYILAEDKASAPQVQTPSFIAEKLKTLKNLVVIMTKNVPWIWFGPEQVQGQTRIRRIKNRTWNRAKIINGQLPSS